MIADTLRELRSRRYDSEHRGLRCLLRILCPTGTSGGSRARWLTNPCVANGCRLGLYTIEEGFDTSLKWLTKATAAYARIPDVTFARLPIQQDHDRARESGAVSLISPSRGLVA